MEYIGWFQTKSGLETKKRLESQLKTFSIIYLIRISHGGKPGAIRIAAQFESSPISALKISRMYILQT
jgi:hypothetical protein